MTTLQLRNSRSRVPLRRGFLLLPFALALSCLALLPTAQAVSPAARALYSKTTGTLNTANGDGALANNTTGIGNTANGVLALALNKTGSANTATGADVLIDNTTGNNNTANGWQSLAHNTIGDNNTAIGFGALLFNTTGNNNTAIGSQALFSNTTGNNNTANGEAVLHTNTTGNHNTANGFGALLFNTTGNTNTAIGSQALYSNTTGNANTATGFTALGINTTGTQNTANGAGALNSNTTGNFNTATGYDALFSNNTASNSTAAGFNALLHNTGSNNIALGSNAGINLTTGNNNIDIGDGGVAAESNHIRIGTVGTQNRTFVAGIYGATVARGVGVIVGSNGHLGTIQSSARFKDEIKPMDKASEAILALKPVTFRYKHELDPEGIPQFGLVAEEVEKVNPQLVIRDENGEAYTVRYEAVNAMLLNEFLKEHRKVEEQQATIAELKSSADSQRAISTKQDAIIAQQQKQIEALTAGLQKVSDRLEASKAAPQLVAENQ